MGTAKFIVRNNAGEQRINLATSLVKELGSFRTNGAAGSIIVPEVINREIWTRIRRTYNTDIHCIYPRVYFNKSTGEFTWYYGYDSYSVYIPVTYVDCEIVYGVM